MSPANIVLVVMDTARADAFEPFGAPGGSTPVVADMARRGAASVAFAPACWTVPSHAGLFSGLAYRAAGFGHPAATHDDYRAAGDRLEHRWLPCVLRRGGYATAGASANMWISDWGGWDRGFDEWVQVTSGRALHGEGVPLRGRLGWYRQALEARVDDGQSEMEGVYRRWLAGLRPGRPFFWFFNLVECHSPYLPPKPFNPLGPWGRVRAADEALRYLNFDAIWKGLCSSTDAPGSAVARMRALYRSAVTMMDSWVGRLLEALDEAGVLDDTVVVVTSDHGENLGENGLVGHGFSLDDRLLRVPAVALGTRSPLPAPAPSLCDVPGWLADAAGVEGHPWSVGDGQVAAAAFDAPAGPDDPRCAEAVRTWGLGEDALRRLSISFACATDGRMKLIWRDGSEELVDLRADPLEASPRPVSAADEERWADRLPLARRALRRAADESVPGVVATEVAPRDAANVEAMEAQMKLLGYL
ncbi:MAG TPA: sulfatase-like hydrolase/transferase [Acidimicrobiales bacterium]|nr:sulfatase-like hydrolase/transferase [Acidimicrobiales bacterium]